MIEHVALVATVAHEGRAHRAGIERVDAVLIDHLQPVELHHGTGRRRLLQPMVEPTGEAEFERTVIDRVLHTHTGHGEERRSANVSV